MTASHPNANEQPGGELDELSSGESMRVKCHNCTAGYTLPESKLKPGRRLQFSCRRCGSRIVVAVPDSGATEAVRSKIGSKLTGTGSAAIGRPSFAPAARASSPAVRRASSSENRRASVPSPAANASRPAFKAAAQSSPAVRERESTDAIRDREESRLAGSVSETRSEKSVRWFVANEDGSYKKWQARDLEVAIRGGLISPETLLWRKGMDGWLAADETPEWRQLYEETGSPDSTKPPADDRVPVGRAVSRVSGRVAIEARAAAEAADDVPSPRRATPHPDLMDEATDAADDEAHASVAGSATADEAQRSVSLPIVRPRQATGMRRSKLQRRQRDASSLKPRGGDGDSFTNNDRSTGTPLDQGDRDGSGKWAPATDTYTGPRGSHTHRIGSEGERAALLGHIEREQRLARSVRNWQWIALGTAAAATLAFVLCFYALLNWQRAAEAPLDCDCETATK